MTDVLIVNDNSSVTGAENVFNVWSEVFKDRKVSCVHPERLDFLEEVSKKGWNSTTYDQSTSPFYKLATIAIMILRSQPKLILINNGGTPGSIVNVLSILVSWFLGRRVIYVFNNMPRQLFGYKKFVVKQCLIKADLIVSASQAALSKLIELYAINMNNCVAIKNYSAPVKRINSISQASGDYPLRLISLGALVPRKGFIELIETLQTEEISQYFTLTIYGEGPLKHQIMNRLEAVDNVCLMPYTKDKSVICNHDIFILNSTCCEDMPYAIIEAMSCKMPIISTKVAGIPELVENGLNGWLIHPLNTQEMVKALYEAWKDKSNLKNKGIESYNKYKLNHSLEIVSSQWSSILGDV
jgi:glycosyltransferase involved in cell wall biosynthesis